LLRRGPLALPAERQIDEARGVTRLA